MERKYNIDVLRILSAIAVVIIHMVSSPIQNSSHEVDAVLADNMWLIHTWMNWSVPVFFMITGYCMLKKQKVTFEYCFSHVLKYVYVLFTVGLVYALMEEVFVAKTISLSIFVQAVLNVISGNLWDHMWYVYEIIGIYLVMPVIHFFMHQGKRNAFILTGILFVFNILLPTFENIIDVGVTLPFGGYLFYVCAGGIMAKHKFGKIESLVIYALGLLSAVWIFVSTEKWDMGYKHLSVCLMAISIFLFFKKRNIKASKSILSVSKCTWGIYLLHPFFMNIVIKVLKIDLVSSYAYVKLFVMTIIIVIVSFLTTCMLRKIPFVKKLF